MAAFAAGGASLILPFRPALANLATDNWPVLRPLLARHWQGYGQAQSAGTESGTITLKLEVDFNPDADMRINGRLRMTSRWVTGTYTATHAIRGYCWGSDEAVGVLIEDSSMVAGDSLPPELYWQGLTGKLQLFSERGTADSWLLSGSLYGTRDSNAFETQLSDHT